MFMQDPRDSRHFIDSDYRKEDYDHNVYPSAHIPLLPQHTADRMVLVCGYYTTKDGNLAQEIDGSDKHVYRIRPSKIELGDMVVLTYIGEDKTQADYRSQYVWEVKWRNN